MKRLWASALAAGLMTAAFFAPPASAQQNQSLSGSDSRAIAIIDNSQPGVTRSKGRLSTTASAIAPGLTAAGVHSCAGSTTAAGGGTGFGFSFGSTYEMQECNRRAYAATLMGMGQNAAALALICGNSEVQNALNLTGVVCPQQQAIRAAAVSAPPPAAAYMPARSSAVVPVGNTYATSSSLQPPAGLPTYCKSKASYSPQDCRGWLPTE